MTDKTIDQLTLTTVALTTAVEFPIWQSAATWKANLTQLAAFIGTAGLSSIPDGDLLANISGGTAQPSAVTASAFLDHVFGTAEGGIIQRGASAWQFLSPGVVGQLLSEGAGPLGSWANISSFLVAGTGITFSGSRTVTISAPSAAGGTVTSIAVGAGLTGGPITTAGTISFNGKGLPLRVNTATITTVTTSDFIVAMNLTTPAISTVVLHASPSAGDEYIVKDSSTTATTGFSTFNCFVSGNGKNIDNSGTYTMNLDGQSARFIYDGTQYGVYGPY